MSSSRRSVETGALWENQYGYHRAVALGEQAWVSGTTAASAGGTPDGDAAAQAEAAFSIALSALQELGFAREDVVRTRMFVTDMGDAEAVGRVHGKVFAGVNPAATMVAVAGLIDPTLLVEIEIEAAKGGSTV